MRAASWPEKMADSTAWGMVWAAAWKRWARASTSSSEEAPNSTSRKARPAAGASLGTSSPASVRPTLPRIVPSLFRFAGATSTSAACAPWSVSGYGCHHRGQLGGPLFCGLRQVHPAWSGISPYPKNLLFHARGLGCASCMHICDVNHCLGAPT